MSSSRSPIPLVDLVAQYHAIQPEMDTAIKAVIEGGQYIGGDIVRQFADQFAVYCNVKHCVPCANGTDALEIALSTLGIGPGDEVILPALTFVATMEAVCNVGATPVFCDIDPVRYTIDPIQAISLVTPRTKAFLPVHLYGQMAELNPLIHFAHDNNMFLVEDAAQAHGALYKGKTAGSLGDMNTFSFYPGKNLGAYGDAGALTTNSEWLSAKALKMANHGRTEKYNHETVGRSSRLDALQAAILAVKLKHLQEWTTSRRTVAQRYHEQLRSIDSIRIPAEFADSTCVYHLYVIRVGKAVREDFRNYLRLQGIETGIHYPVALTRLQVTTEQLNIHVSCPEAEKASEEVVSLPIYPELSPDQQDYICDQIRSYFA